MDRKKKSESMTKLENVQNILCFVEDATSEKLIGGQ